MITRTTTGTPTAMSTLMLDDFTTRALLAGLGVALAAGPLGSFVVWRRMAYFGDATSHAAILGVALALAFQLPLTVGVLTVSLAMAMTPGSVGHSGGLFSAARQTSSLGKSPCLKPSISTKSHA